MGDRLDTFSKVGDGLAGISAILALMVGVSAITYAHSQIQEGRANEARSYYRDFMALQIQYPEFSRPNYAAIRQDALKLEQYQWFVAYMLSAFEELRATQGEDAGWMHSIQRGLADHRDYIASPEFKSEFCDYDEGFRQDMRKAVGVALPACTVN